jgi:prophage regulatory protein
MNPFNQHPQPVAPKHGATITDLASRATTPPKPGCLLRLHLVEEKTGLKKSTIYAGMKAGTFPAPVRLSARAVGWREEVVDSWIVSRLTTGAQ